MDQRNYADYDRFVVATTLETLRPADVHVWVEDLDVGPDRLDRLTAFLSADELERAGRFRFRRDRDRFTAGRGRLRELLGQYLACRPGDVDFRYSAYGKPFITGSAGLRFNVSHSGPRVLFAFCRDAEVGVDVELLRAEAADDLVAERFFAEREVLDLRRLPPALRVRGFLSCWTRKEAYIKARGEGLSLPLQDFEVTLSPNEPPKLVRTAWSPGEPAEWRLHDLSHLCTDAVAALAIRGQPRNIVAVGEFP